MPHPHALSAPPPPSERQPTGYEHATYAAALAGFGRPTRLPRSGGWVLERPIDGADAVDAMGLYPLFACEDWSGLAEDLHACGEHWVSIALVVDPLHRPADGVLDACFDRVRPFKPHWIVDLEAPFEETTSKHHRYYARRARRHVEVERCQAPEAHLGAWVRLYDQLIERHGITGLQAFSRESFAQQLQVPGLVMFRAEVDGRTVGAHLWYEMGEVAYSHLAAVDATGYRMGASYALYERALRHFRPRVRWLNLGGGAGLDADEADGLSRFKKGWATGSQPALFCGRVFQPEAYDALVRARQPGPTAYFPAYRAGEHA